MSRSRVPILILNPRGVDRLRRGAPWLYPQDVARVPEGTSPGVVGLVDGRSRWLGHALYSPDSKLMVRFLSPSRQRVDDSFIKERIRRAVDFRDDVLGYAGRSCRLVHGEADGLPGVVVDRIGDGVVIQSLTAGADAVLDWVVSAVEEILDPRVLVIKNTAQARVTEGLETYQRLVRGESAVVRYEENGLVFEIDLLEGQKTGVFLDQVENHALMARIARGRALDLYSYTGGFGLAMARAGCEVTCVDASERAMDALGRAAQINGLSVRGVVSDVGEFLAHDDGKYDTIVCDPPAFAKRRSHVPRAMKAYSALAERVLDHLRPGGVALFCSCSSHVLPDDLMEAIRTGARGRRFVVLRQTGAGPDHPSLPGFPQTAYLKCFLVRLLEK